MKEFETFHPVCNMIYYISAMSFAMVNMHPVCVIVSLFSSSAYLFFVKGKKGFDIYLKFIIPVTLAVSLINPLISHGGITVITYLFSNPITAESFFYGIMAAFSAASIICLFLTYNEIMTSEKFIYLFSKKLPVISLLVSMTMRFGGIIKERLKRVYDIKLVNRNNRLKITLKEKLTIAAKVFSSVIVSVAEDSLKTAHIMKARGYGVKKRTSFSLFKFKKRDGFVCVVILISDIFLIVLKSMDYVKYRYYPSVLFDAKSVCAYLYFLVYFIMCILPCIIEIKEAIKWKRLKSKI